MKIALIILASCLFLASCSSVDSTIVGRDILTDSTKYNAAVIDPVTHKPTVIQDSVYHVRPDFHEKFLLAEHLHSLWKMYVLMIIGIALIFLSIIKMYQTSGSFGYVALIILGILLIGAGLGTIGWSDSKEGTIEKTVYDAEMAQHGNLEHWWIDEGNLYK